MARLITKIKSLFKISKKKFILIIIIIIVAALFGNRFFNKKPQIETAKIERKDIETVVTASGLVKTENSSDLYFAAAGKVIWVGVKEGDTVYQGQAIASIDKEKYEIALRQAKQEVVATDAALQKVYDSLPKDKVESFTDKVNRTAAEANKNQAFDSVKEAERQLRNTTIYSPIAGTITSVNVIPGQEILALSTTPAASVSETDKKTFVTDVDETDIGKINLGQDALIILDAFPNEKISSSVSQIAEKASVTTTGATGFQVTFDIAQDEKNRLGMNGETQITTAKNENALVIPLEALIDEKFVWVKNAQGYEKKEVMTGLQSDTEAEIVSGLEENQAIVISGADEIGKKTLLQKILPFIFR